jgi:hypothetical protein
MPLIRSRLWRTGFFAFVLLLLMLFPYGPLFPWSPVKPGFEHLALQRADIYYPSGMTLDPAYRRVDEFIAESERFHWLHAPARISVIACGDWTSFGRFLPQHRGSRAVGAVTLATGTAIYVSPRVTERGFDVGEFLRHEISHATIHQNQKLLSAYRLGEVPWLVEGIAVAYGKQKAYYTLDEFVTRARREKDVAWFVDPARRSEVRGIFDMRYAYTAWRYFNESLMARDRAAYQRYLRAVMDDPRKWRECFAAHFGLDFAGALARFEGEIR